MSQNLGLRCVLISDPSIQARLESRIKEVYATLCLHTVFAGPQNGTCQSGYWKKDGGCCFGIDAQTSLSHPLHFGFDEFVATPECAASATTNCGCFFWPSAHNNTPCELGHYEHPFDDPTGTPRSWGKAPYLECMQYYAGNYSGKGTARPLSPRFAISCHISVYMR